MKDLKSEIKLVIEGKGGNGILLLGQLLGSLFNTCYDNIAIAPSYSAERLGGDSCSKVIASKGIILNPMPEYIDIGIMFNGASGDIINPLSSTETTLLKEVVSVDSTQIILNTINKSDICISIPHKYKFRSNICFYTIVAILLQIDRETVYSVLKQFFTESGSCINFETIEYVYQNVEIAI